MLIMKHTDNETNRAFLDFLDIIETLRSPGGCPWDIEQTPSSLRANLIEECYETVEAIEENNPLHVREELGDVLLLVAMISQIHSESDDFNIVEVLEEIVFGDVKVHDTEEVLKNWDKIKIEVEGRDKDSSALSGIPGNLPPLERSYKKGHIKYRKKWLNEVLTGRTSRAPGIKF